MSVANQHREQMTATGVLPTWWRYLLVATATLILCSCRGVPRSAEELDVGRVTANGPDSADVASAVRFQSPDGIDIEVQISDNEVVPVSYVVADDHCPLDGAPPPLPLPPAPSAAPCAPIVPCAPYTVVGPSDEYLCDGGDFGVPAAVRADWSVEGVQPEDAVAHYDTVDGQVVVEPSNRVCIYAPRFAAVRRVRSLMADEQRQPIDVVLNEFGPAQADESTPVATSVQRQAAAVDLGELPPSLFRQRQQAGGLDNSLALIDVYSTLAPSVNLTIIRTGQVDGSEGAQLERAVQSAVAWNGDQSAQVLFENEQAVAVVGLRQPGLVYQTSGPNSPRLRLLKLASTGSAEPGDEVQFTLRFDNIGDQVIGNVTVIDNLTTRLEYVPDSARCTVDADFGTEANGAGSLVLRWEVKAPVEPGEGGVVTFRCRVR